MPKIMSTKFVSRMADAENGDGREVHELEVDGLGNFEVKVTIPAALNAMEDLEARATAVSALAATTSADVIEQAAADHAG